MTGSDFFIPSLGDRSYDLSHVGLRHKTKDFAMWVKFVSANYVKFIGQLICLPGNDQFSLVYHLLSSRQTQITNISAKRAICSTKVLQSSTSNYHAYYLSGSVNANGIRSGLTWANNTGTTHTPTCCQRR